MAPWLPVILKKYFRYDVLDRVPGRFFTKVVKQALEERMENKMVRFQNNLPILKRIDTMFRSKSDQIKAKIRSNPIFSPA